MCPIIRQGPGTPQPWDTIRPNVQYAAFVRTSPNPPLSYVPPVSNPIKGDSPWQTAVDTYLIAKELVDSYFCLVYICGALHRQRGISSSVLNMENLVLDFNDNLKELCDGEEFIFYHQHRGFWEDQSHHVLPVDYWSKDGIHPNSFVGRDKYKKYMYIRRLF